MSEENVNANGGSAPDTAPTERSRNDASQATATASNRRVDYSKYTKVQENKDTVAEDEVRITNKNKIDSYVSYALALFEEKGIEKITLKAMGRCIFKAVTAAEVCKRRLAGLHQITDIVTERIVDRFEPVDPESGLEPFERVRNIPCLTILLSTNKDLVDTSHKGYQPPLPDAEVVPRDQDVFINTRIVENPGSNSGRGRGSSNNRNWRKNNPQKNRGGGQYGNRGGGRGGRGGQMNQPLIQPQMPQQGMNMMSPYGMMMPQGMTPNVSPNGQWMMMPMQGNPYDPATIEAMQSVGIVPSIPMQQGGQQQYAQYDDRQYQSQQQQQNNYNNNRRQGQGSQGRGGRGGGGGRRNNGEQRGGNRDRRGGGRSRGSKPEDGGQKGRRNNKGGNKQNQRRQRAPSDSAFPPMAVIQSSNPSAAAAKYMDKDSQTQATTSQNGGMAVGASGSVEGVAITSSMNMSPPEAAFGERTPWQQALLRGPPAPNAGTSSTEEQSNQHNSHSVPSGSDSRHQTAAQRPHEQETIEAPPVPGHTPNQQSAYSYREQQQHSMDANSANTAPISASYSSDRASEPSVEASKPTTWARILGGR